MGPMQAPRRAGAVLVFCRSCDQLRARVLSGWHFDKQSTNCKGKIAARGDHSVDALPRIQKEQNLLSFVSIRSLSTVLQHSCSPRACDLRAVWRGETRMGARIAGRTHSNHAFTSAAAPRGARTPSPRAHGPHRQHKSSRARHRAVAPSPTALRSAGKNEALNSPLRRRRGPRADAG